MGDVDELEPALRGQGAVQQGVPEARMRGHDPGALGPALDECVDLLGGDLEDVDQRNGPGVRRPGVLAHGGLAFLPLGALSIRTIEPGGRMVSRGVVLSSTDDAVGWNVRRRAGRTLRGGISVMSESRCK